MASSAISSVSVRTSGSRVESTYSTSVEAERRDEADRFVGGLLVLALQLVGRAEEVRVVLREAAHAREAVQRAAAFEAVDGAELGVAQRQIAVRAPFAAIDQDVPGAVHRFEPEALTLDFERPEHAVRVVFVRWPEISKSFSLTTCGVTTC
jgi:hypothetical protein